MVGKRLRPRPITRTDFKPYGWLIDYPRRPSRGVQNLFKVLIRQPKGGWRIAYLVVRDKRIDALERHPDSLESFEPVTGRGLLYVATKKSEGAIRCFYLDKPVILKKGVWHGVIALSKEFDVKIVENAKVACVYWPLGFKLC